MFNPKQLRKAVQSYKKDIVAFARRIVATPSFSGKEGALVKVLAAEMRKVGFDQVQTDRMGNIIGRIGSGKTKIMMDAHIDTVGIGDRSAWKWDPFKGKFDGKNIFGRGATDQKLSMASMVYAGKAIKDLKLKGDYTLWVVGSCLEEDWARPSRT